MSDTINLAQLRAECDRLDTDWPEFEGKSITHLTVTQLRALIDAVEAANELYESIGYAESSEGRYAGHAHLRLGETLKRFDHEPSP